MLFMRDEVAKVKAEITKLLTCDALHYRYIYHFKEGQGINLVRASPIYIFMLNKGYIYL
jgi:hypothetical protein